MNQQISDLLELAGLRDVENVVAAIVQIVAGTPDGAQRGVARDDAGQRDGLLARWRAGGSSCVISFS